MRVMAAIVGSITWFASARMLINRPPRVTHTLPGRGVLFGVGALVRRRMNLSSEARQDLFALRQATHETVQLAILDHADIMYVYNLESTQAIRTPSTVGTRHPAHSSSLGKVILAFSDPGEVEAAGSEVGGGSSAARAMPTAPSPSCAASSP